MKTAELKSMAKWREQSNPLIGLSPERLIQMRQAGRQGIFAELQYFYFCAMRACPTLAAIRLRRRSAIQRLDWDIEYCAKPPAGYTEADCEAQEHALRDAYEKIDNLSDAFRFLSLAPFHGFAHMQKHRDTAGDIIHLEPLDQWNWVRDGLRGAWFWNPTAQNANADSIKGQPGAAIDPAEFIVIEEEIPIIEACLNLFFQESIGGKDWAHFVEVFGIPGAVVIGPKDIPPGKELDYKTAAEEVAEGASGYLPNGSLIEFSTDPRNTSPFQPYIDDKRAQMVLVGTGGKLTMLAESGSGTLAGGAHTDSFNEIAEAESMAITEAFQRGIDKEILAKRFPGQPQLAYFQLSKPEENDAESQAKIVQMLSAAGFDVDPEQVSERTGFKVTKKEPIDFTQNPPEAAPGAGEPTEKPEDDKNTANATLDEMEATA